MLSRVESTVYLRAREKGARICFLASSAVCGWNGGERIRRRMRSSVEAQRRWEVSHFHSVCVCVCYGRRRRIHEYIAVGPAWLGGGEVESCFWGDATLRGEYTPYGLLSSNCICCVRCCSSGTAGKVLSFVRSNSLVRLDYNAPCGRVRV